jgi:LacI family transcriptional regulator
VLKSHGVKVPGDVSLTGFDHTEEKGDDLPGLSTVHVPKELMGIRAVELLFRRLKEPDQPNEKTLIYGDVLMRQTVRKISIEANSK